MEIISTEKFIVLTKILVTGYFHWLGHMFVNFFIFLYVHRNPLVEVPTSAQACDHVDYLDTCLYFQFVIVVGSPPHLHALGI
jgi:hypothetical protein